MTVQPSIPQSKRFWSKAKVVVLAVVIVAASVIGGLSYLASLPHYDNIWGMVNGLTFPDRGNFQSGLVEFANGGAFNTTSVVTSTTGGYTYGFVNILLGNSLAVKILWATSLGSHYSCSAGQLFVPEPFLGTGQIQSRQDVSCP